MRYAGGDCRDGWLPPAHMLSTRRREETGNQFHAQTSSYCREFIYVCTVVCYVVMDVEAREAVEAPG